MKRILNVVFVILFMFNMFGFSAYASSISNYGELKVLGKDELPQIFKLKINSTYTEHEFFLQSTVQEDGSFVIYTRGRMDDGRWFDLDVNYVDIYDENGKFVTEIQFETSSDVAVEINDSVVNIYLYSEVIRYDILTEKIEYLLIPDAAAQENGIIKRLRTEEFSVGGWNYSYEECFEGYDKLIRSKGEATEVVFELDGTNTSFFNPITVVSFFLFCLWVCYKFVKLKRKSN